jgi:hypothetical protein
MFQSHQLAEALSDFPAPINLAPKPIREAWEAVARASSEVFDAEGNLEDKIIEQSNADAEYEAAGLEATRLGSKELPNPATKDRTRWAVTNAKGKLREAEQKLRLERGNLATLLDNQDNRTAWLTATHAETETDRKLLLQKLGEVAEIQAKFASQVNFSYWLGDFGNWVTPPGIAQANPTAELSKLANSRSWKPGEALDTKTRWATPEVLGPADLDEVFLTSLEGATHTMTRKDATRLMASGGYLIASVAETARWYERQGLTPPKPILEALKAEGNETK